MHSNLSANSMIPMLNHFFKLFLSSYYNFEFVNHKVGNNFWIWVLDMPH